MNLKEMRAAAIKAARDIAEKAKAENRDLTADENTEIEGKLAEADDLKAQIEQLEKGRHLLDKLEKMGPTDGAHPDRPEGGDDLHGAKSLGDHFIKAAGDTLARQAAGSRTETSAPEFKAADSPALPPADSSDLKPWGTELRRSIVNQRRERLVAADLMGSAAITLPTIKYLVEKANRIAEGAPATVKPGGRKPYVRFEDFDVVTESLSKIAALTKLADEMVEDYGFVADWINNQLIYELSVAEEDQLLNGDGTGSNVTGLLNRDIQKHDASGDVFDGLYEAIQKVPLATNLTADGLLINPADYGKLRLTKDGNGQYIAGGPFQGQYGNGGIMIEPPVWGLRTVVTQAVAEGTAVVGAFRQGATVLRKGGLRVDSTNTNVDDFEHNLVTLRAEERVGLMVPLPDAFVEVSLAGDASGEA